MRLLLLLLLPVFCSGQELNFGLHLSPLLPLPHSTSTKAENMVIRPSGISFNAGADLRLAAKKWYIGSEFDFLKRSYAAGFVYRDGLAHKTYALTRVTNTSLEVPVTLGIRLHHHEARYKYNVFLTGAVAHGWGGGDVYSGEIGSYNSSSATYSSAKFTDLKGFGPYRSFAIGANVHAILRKAGLLSYGLEFHYPMEEGPHYSIDITDVNSNHIVITEPRLPHLDVKLCYYFFSVDGHLRRIRYRK